MTGVEKVSNTEFSYRDVTPFLSVPKESKRDHRDVSVVGSIESKL